MPPVYTYFIYDQNSNCVVMLLLAAHTTTCKMLLTLMHASKSATCTITLNTKPACVYMQVLWGMGAIIILRAQNPSSRMSLV